MKEQKISLAVKALKVMKDEFYFSVYVLPVTKNFLILVMFLSDNNSRCSEI